MLSTSPSEQTPIVRSTASVLVVIVLVALNLRIALSSLPAVTTAIQEETGWSDTAMGSLTTVPVLCMGAFALTVPRIASRIGRNASVIVALVSMTFGMLLRLLGANFLALTVSALLAGLSIAMIGGLVPGIVRDQLSGSNGLAASLWTAAMMGGAALGAALTLPLSEVLGGWNRALAVWALPAAVALVAWLWLEKGTSEDDRRSLTLHIRDLPWRNPVAWSLTAMTTLNSIVFYSSIAWIAPSYQERGFSAEVAALFLALFTGMHIAGALILPAWSHRTRARRTLFSATIISSMALIVAIAIVPTTAPVLVIALLGFTLSGGFVMPLGLLSEYAANEAAAIRLTAMVFSVTFLVAAFGPSIAGFLMDTLNSWTLVYSLLAVVVALQLAAVPQLRRGPVIN